MLSVFVNRIVSILTLAGFASTAGAQSPKTGAPADRTMQLKAGDRAMAQAIQRARAGLPRFLAIAEAPGGSERDFSLKIGIPVDPNVEYVWVRPFERNGDGFMGRLVNDATIMPNMKYGQWVSFDEDNIVDWSYREGNRLVGNQTACALMRTLPLAEQAAFRQRYGLTCDP